MVDIYEDKLSVLKEEQNKQLEELRRELEEKYQEKLEERKEINKVLKQKLDEQERMYEKQVKIKGEQQYKQQCEFAFKEEEYKNRIGELEEVYQRRVKELVAQGKKTQDLEKEFQHLMEDQEKKTREIERKYENMLHRMQEELQKNSKWIKKKFFWK